MNAKVYGIDGKETGEIELPALFSQPIRLDLIQRAVLSDLSRTYQPKGNYIYAGLETSAKYRGRKEAWGSIKNMGISRLPREVLAKGRFGKVKRIPSSVKGRRAHPPKVEKRIIEEMNQKEYKKAMWSALSATCDKKLLEKRHLPVEVGVPVIFDDKFESLAKTKDVKAVLDKFFKLDMDDAKSKKHLKSGIRCKRRSQRRKYRKSVLIIASHGSPVLNAARNIAGVDVSDAQSLKVSDICPGAIPRISVFSRNSLKEISKQDGAGL